MIVKTEKMPVPIFFIAPNEEMIREHERLAGFAAGHLKSREDKRARH
jgi:hypothetical protein